MIIVFAKVAVKEGKKDELLALAKPLMAATRQEEGNVSYTLFDDRYDPASLMFVEEWESMEALKKHTTTAHIAEWRQKQKEFLAGPTQIKLYKGEETSF